MRSYNVFSDFCKKYRYALLFTQQQLADYLKVSLSTVKKWESGTVRIPAKWLFVFQDDIEDRFSHRETPESMAIGRRIDRSGLLDLLSQAIDCSVPGRTER